MATIDLGPCDCCGGSDPKRLFLCCLEVVILSCSAGPCPSCGEPGYTAPEGVPYIECYAIGSGAYASTYCGGRGTLFVSCEDARRDYYIDPALNPGIYLQRAACPESAALGQNVTC